MAKLAHLQDLDALAYKRKCHLDQLLIGDLITIAKGEESALGLGTNPVYTAGFLLNTDRRAG